MIRGPITLTDQLRDTIINPRVVVEVLSPSTADYDYGGKFALYRSLPSFEEYVLVAQDQPRVEVFHKALDGSWVLRTYEGLQSSFRLESLSITLTLTDIYDGIDLISG